MATKQPYAFKPDYVTPYPASFWNNLEAQYYEQLAKSKNPDHPDDLIRNWLRNPLELLGIWEQLHNPEFNPVEFDGV